MDGNLALLSKRDPYADLLYYRKVAIVLEELGLTYESIYLDFDKGEQKSPEHTKYNPNGRIPTLIDHKNNDFTLWSVGTKYRDTSVSCFLIHVHI